MLDRTSLSAGGSPSANYLGRSVDDFTETPTVLPKEERNFVNLMRIALANLRFPATPDESVSLAEQAIYHASVGGARIICFPECFVPGYRIGKSVPPPDPGFLERGWSLISATK